jgi:uncharacterized protein (DUF427 family)
MSLTIGTGPLSPEAAGKFNSPLGLPERLLLFDPYLPRVRALFEGETVVDSLRTMLLHETGRLPVFYFPLSDVRDDLLEPSGKSVEAPGKGVASLRTLRVGDRTAPDAAWVFEEPVPEASFLRDHVTFEWGAIDEWFTEDEQLFGHPRDPYSRIDVFKSTRHVRVSLGGELLAESRRPKVLYETALPPRMRIGDRLVEDLVWTYRDPQHDATPVADHLCFFNERVDLEVDGERMERPRTQWSRDED